MGAAGSVEWRGAVCDLISELARMAWETTHDQQNAAFALKLTLEDALGCDDLGFPPTETRSVCLSILRTHLARDLDLELGGKPDQTDAQDSNTERDRLLRLKVAIQNLRIELERALDRVRLLDAEVQKQTADVGRQ